MYNNMQQAELVINYDLYITKQGNNGEIIEYSLYEKKYNMNITNMAHLIVTEDKNYCDYKMVNNELVELTESEKQALLPTPIPTMDERITQLEVLQVNSMSMQIENKLLGGTV